MYWWTAYGVGILIENMYFIYIYSMWCWRFDWNSFMCIYIYIYRGTAHVIGIL